MRLTVQEWEAMPEIKLPWHGSETKFTVTEIRGVCGECGSRLSGLRGNIYESCGVVEVVMAGVCQNCNHLVPCRSRVYPKSGVFAQEVGGQWVRSNLVTFGQKWRRETTKMMVPAMVGITFAIVMSIVFANPTKWTYIFWGVTVVGLTAFFTIVGYFSAKRG